MADVYRTPDNLTTTSSTQRQLRTNRVEPSGSHARPTTGHCSTVGGAVGAASVRGPGMVQQHHQPSNGNSRHSEDRYFQLSAYRLVVWFLVPLPLLGFITCVTLSIVYDFKRSTSTHCRVPNYLPTISSAIGEFTPQRYIWQLCIALHSTPRLVKALILYNYYNGLTTRKYPRLYKGLVRLALVIHLAELLALLMLTYISSSDYYEVHENSFIAFMVCSLIYMLLTCIIMKWGHALKGMPSRVSKCFKCEVTFFISNFASFMVAIYFFFRHNTYCEPGVYTIFAALEYITVITNICFHGSAAILFGRQSQIYATFGDTKQD